MLTPPSDSDDRAGTRSAEATKESTSRWRGGLLKRRPEPAGTANADHVKFNQPEHADGLQDGSAADPSGEEKQSDRLPKVIRRLLDPVEAWIKRCLPWSALKPILRTALLLEIAVILLLIGPVQRASGNASFLILIGALIAPAELPLVLTIEREFFNVALACISWAWANIGLKLAHLARDHPLSPAEVDPSRVYTGAYLEAKSSIIIAVFLALGSAFFMGIKVGAGPGRYLFGSIFGAILMTISATTGALFPYPLYSIGQAVAVPLAIQAGLVILLSTIFYPKSVNSLYVEKLQQLLTHVSLASCQQCEIFKQDPTEEGYDFNTVSNLVTAAEAAVAPMQAASRLLQREVSFGLLSGADLEGLQQHAIELISPSDGISSYFRMIEMDLKSEHFPGTPSASRPHSFASTPASSRPPSPEPSDRAEVAETGRLHQSSTPEADASHHFSTQFFRSHRPPSLSIGGVGARSRHKSKSRTPVPVATYESLRFARVEAQLHTRAADAYTVKVYHLLGEANGDLLTACGEAMDEVLQLLKSINATRMMLFRRWLLQAVGGAKPQLAVPGADSTAEKGESVEVQVALTLKRKKLEDVLEEFKRERRHLVDKPFITASIHAALPESLKDEIRAGQPSEYPHRYLYQAYVHIFHTISYSERLIELLKLIEELDCTHRRARFWFPSLPHLLNMKLFTPGLEEPHEADADEDETRVEGTTAPPDTAWHRTKRRDPDALEPTNVFQRAGLAVYTGLRALFRGNMLFAMKAGVLVTLVSLPAYFKSTAEFAYREKLVWPIIMAQLTLNRWRGETIFGLVSRITTTIVGCAVGLVIWYIAAGSGRGNSYAIAAVWGVASIPIAAWRLQGSGPPIALIITCVTIGLVVGYSIQDTRNPAPSTVGYGFEVGWRRLVGVVIGVTAAGIWSLLPPIRTIGGYTRSLSATTITKLGEIYCAVMTTAANPHEESLEDAASNLMAVRAKLRRVAVIQEHAGYEISLRGPWPKDEYSKLNKTQMEVAKLLSHLVSIIQRLQGTQKHALMQETRFLDTIFMADVISVFYMASTALRAGAPLPQLTAAPLVDRFLLLESEFVRRRTWRSEHRIQRGENEDTMGFPKHFCAELLEDEAFLTLSVALATGFGILLRLDRLMVCTKALVGEAYPVGAASFLYFAGNEDAAGEPSAAHHEPPREQ